MIAFAHGHDKKNRKGGRDAHGEQNQIPVPAPPGTNRTSNGTKRGFACLTFAAEADTANRTGAWMLDFPVAPPIFVKDTPHSRKIATLSEARTLVDEMLHQRRLTTLRDVKARLDGAKTPEDAVEAIGALRELLVDEDLTA
jgi:hypothetical protein